MIAVDVESSGTEAHVHSILSVGAVDTARPERQFYEECRAWEGAKIEDEALAVNGFTHEQATDPAKQTEGQLVQKFVAWASACEEQTFAGQNVSFDRDFLKYAAGRAGHTAWPFAHRTIDSHTLCYMHMVKRGLTPPLKEGQMADETVRYAPRISIANELERCVPLHWASILGGKPLNQLGIIITPEQRDKIVAMLRD